MITCCVRRCERESFSDEIISTPPIKSNSDIVRSRYQLPNSAIGTTYAVYFVTLNTSTEWGSFSGRHQRKLRLSQDRWSSQQYLIAYRYSYLYWPMRWLIGYWSKEFGRDGMLLWVPVSVNSRSVGLLLTYKNRTWKWISRIKYERCIYR